MQWPDFAYGAAATAALWVLREIIAPDFLDWRKQRRGADLQREAEARSHDREDEPVRRRVSAALLEELRGLRRGLLRGQFSLGEWQARHDTLRLLDGADAARALGDQYQHYRDALEYDQLSINIATRDREELDSVGGSDDDPMRRYAIRQHDARGSQNIAQVVMRFTPLLTALGEKREAARFEYVATTQDLLAVRILSELPPYA